MSDPNAPPLELARIVQELDRHGVEYVLVGGVGAQLHGATRRTLDFDVCPRWERANLGRLAGALQALDAKLKVPDLPPGLQLPPVSADTLRAMEISTWRTAAGDIDVLLGIPADSQWSLNRFDSLRQRAHPRELGGCTLYVADLDDIIASKRVANRLPDQEALPELQALSERSHAVERDPPAPPPPLRPGQLPQPGPSPQPPPRRPPPDRGFGR